MEASQGFESLVMAVARGEDWGRKLYRRQPSSKFLNGLDRFYILLLNILTV